MNKDITIEFSSNRILLFGGVYSNLQALESLKKVANEKGFLPNQIICNGDIVGYCAQPEESVQFVKEWGIHCILGNVEENLRDGIDDCGCDFDEGTRCDVFSRQWYPYAQQHVSNDSIQWMRGLPTHLRFELGGKRWAVVHGSFSHISQFIFQSTPWEEKEKQLELAEVDGVIAGHCGLPFSQERNGKHWINPGVIGMPANDGNTHVWYAILSKVNEGIKVEHYQLNYDHVTANRLMLQEKLPASYAKTLLTGIWDNCEILPEEETKNQGEDLKLII